MKLKNDNLLRSQAYVNGEWVNAKDGGTFPVINPATGEQITQVADLGAAETEEAVKAAETAFTSWRQKTAKERATIMRRWNDFDPGQPGRPGSVDDSGARQDPV